VGKFPGAESRQHERKENRELPVIAGFQEFLFLIGAENGNGFGIFDRDAVQIETGEWVFGIRRKVPSFYRVAKHAPAALQDVFDAFVEQGTLLGILVSIGSHFDRTQIMHKLFCVSDLE